MATKAKNRPRRGGGVLFTDRESAMRHMRFQGHTRAPSKKGRQTGNPGLDTGWGHKNAKVFDEKIGLRRNEAVGPGRNLHDKSITYIDTNRMVEGGLDDIKTVMSNAKKKNLHNKAKLGSSCMDRWADETEFKDSGGVSGYISRAKNLIDKWKLYAAAVPYLDIAIKHGLQNFYIMEREDAEVLFARELKATCLLNLANYSEAEKEAAHILLWAPDNGKALHIYAESLYLQCKFERALMIFHRGFRLRTELYSQTFQRGVIKTTEIILHTIKSLNAYKDGPEAEKIIPDVNARGLIRRSFFEDNFLSNDESPRFEDAFEVMWPSPFKAEAHFKSQWNKAKKSYKKKKRNSKFSPGDNQSSLLGAKNNWDLRRLKEDAVFMDTLCDMFNVKHDLTSEDMDQKSGGYSGGNAKDKRLEESGWDLSTPEPKRGTYDQEIANMASECLSFIEGRKHFWALQTYKKPSHVV